MSATPPRPDGEGGWLCEVGTAWLTDRHNENGRRTHRADPGRACKRPALYIRAGVDPRRPKPGTVVCDVHLDSNAEWRPLLRIADPPEPPPAQGDGGR